MQQKLWLKLKKIEFKYDQPIYWLVYSLFEYGMQLREEKRYKE